MFRIGKRFYICTTENGFDISEGSVDFASTAEDLSEEELANVAGGIRNENKLVVGGSNQAEGSVGDDSLRFGKIVVIGSGKEDDSIRLGFTQVY